MFYRIRGVRQIAAIASLSLLPGCGLISAAASGGENEIVVGTTSGPSTLDPADAWDSSWELFRNIYQTLLAYPVGQTEPKPDAAESCGFTDKKKRTYRCTLREGLKFSNGDPLDAAAVKFSIDRIRRINEEGGPAGLLTNLDKVQTKGDSTVIFRLRQPDATFPFVLATPAMSIVDPQAYPADAIRRDGKITGSGPYELKSYVDGEKAVLVKNGSYQGFAERKNKAVTIRYFHDSASMVRAVRNKEIDATIRGLGADDIVKLQDHRTAGDISLVEEPGMESSYLVFNPKDPVARKLPVRRAIAQLIDRDAIAHDVYKDTVDPLYSMIPQGLTGHSAGYFDEYGKPDPYKARDILLKAGVKTPVSLTLWYASDRYGSQTKPMFEEIKRELESSKLFRITLKHRRWNQFQEDYKHGKYAVFGRGWTPDYPDPDDFIAPFVGRQNALGTPYDIPEITEKLLPQSRRISNRADVREQFIKANDAILQDARLIPLWQSKLYVATNDEISGCETAFDASMIMMVWQLSRKTSW